MSKPNESSPLLINYSHSKPPSHRPAGRSSNAELIALLFLPPWQRDFHARRGRAKSTMPAIHEKYPLHRLGSRRLDHGPCHGDIPRMAVLEVAARAQYSQDLRDIELK